MSNKDDIEDTNSDAVSSGNDSNSVQLALANINIAHCTADNNDAGIVQENNTDDDCKIMMLDDDCLRHVFSFLSQRQLISVERVCKWWQSISFDCWRSITHVSVEDITNESSFDSHGYFRLKSPFHGVLECILKRCGNYVTSLNMSLDYYLHCEEIDISLIVQYCTMLQYLNISGRGSVCTRSSEAVFIHLTKLEVNLYKARDDDLIMLFKACPNIRSLSVCASLNVVSLAVCLLSLNLKAMEEFSLHRYERSVKTLIPGLERMVNLKSLTLDCESVYEATQKDFFGILSAFPNLEILDLKLDSLFPKYSTTLLTGISKKLLSLEVSETCFINDLVLKEIGNNCLNLEQLNISKCWNVTEVGISTIVKLPHLKKLSMSRIGNQKCVTDNHMEQLASKGKLAHLEIQQSLCITDVGCSMVIIGCEDLEYFEISDCPLVGDATIIAAETAVKCRTNDKKLKLVIGGTGVSEKEKWQNLTPMLTLKYPMVILELPDEWNSSNDHHEFPFDEEDYDDHCDAHRSDDDDDDYFTFHHF